MHTLKKSLNHLILYVLSIFLLCYPILATSQSNITPLATHSISVPGGTIQVDITDICIEDNTTHLVCYFTNNTDAAYTIYRSHFYFIDSQKQDYVHYSRAKLDDDNITVRAGARNKFILSFEGADLSGNLCELKWNFPINDNLFIPKYDLLTFNITLPTK